MELENLNCPNCGGPVQISKNTTPFNCQHCGSALVVREEAGVSLLELSDKIVSLIEGGNQEILSAIHNTGKDTAETRLYQSQLEQELTALSVQLVPFKSEFSTLRSSKQDANIVRRIQTISIQIYMLLERTRLLRGKLNEVEDIKKPLLDQLLEQYQYIQSELSYLSYAGKSPDVLQFKANLSTQGSHLEKQMVEAIQTGLASSALPQHPENDIKVLSEQLKIVQADIRAVSALAATSATQKVLQHLRAKQKELIRLMGKIQSEAQQAHKQQQLETKLTDLRRKKDEILRERKLATWESILFFFREQSIRRPGVWTMIGVSAFFCSLCFILAAISTPSLATSDTIITTPQDVSGLQTAAFETAMAGIYQTATANAPTIAPTLAVTSTPTLTSTPESAQGTIIQDVANMRSAPSLDAPVLPTLAINSNVLAVANSTDKIWLLVTTDDGMTGWIHNSLAQFSVSLEYLPISTEAIPTATGSSTPLPTKTPRPSWVNQAPVGTWCEQNEAFGVCVGSFEYRNKLSYSVAAAGSRFIVLGILVKNVGYFDFMASPLDVTLITENGRTFNYAAETYAFSNGFETTTISPDNYAAGTIVFLVPSDVAPRKFIYEAGWLDENVVIDLQDPPTP